MKSWLTLFFLIGTVYSGIAQSIPQIIDYQSSDYKGEHQNWMITQGCKGHMYVANSAGVLIYNGLRWQLVEMPRNQRPRSVFRGKDCRVYVGGYEYFGYIDTSNPAHPAFINIADTLLNGSNQEIWNIMQTNGDIVFQSFSDLYILNDQKIESVPTPNNIMLGSTVRDLIYIPKISNSIYQLDGNQLTELETSFDLPKNCRTAGITPYQNTSKLLIGSQYQGLFILGEEVEIVKNTLSSNLRKEQINKMITLENGDIAIGTILNGVYIADADLNIKYHINKESGLANNTVLSLYQDRNHDLWIGLDKGLNVLKLSSDDRFFYDRKGILGTVFTSIMYQGSLYLGTNQGLFKEHTNESFRLIDNSQGQIWSLIAVDGDLLIGHNNGTFQLIDGQFEKISDYTGGWHMVRLPNGDLLQSTYNGLIVLHKKQQKWTFKHIVANSTVQLSRFTLEGRRIIGKRPTYGIAIITLNEDYTEVLKAQIIESIDDQTISDDVILNLSEDPQGFTLHEHFYQLDQAGDITKVAAKDSSNFTHTIDYVQTIKKILAQYATTNTNYINKSSFQDKYLFGIDEGFTTVAKKSNLTQPQFPTIQYLMANDSIIHDSSTALGANQNNIVIQFQDTSLTHHQNSTYYKLDGWDGKYYRLPRDGRITFRNLDNGQYTLSLRQDGTVASTLLNFEIAPHWYESWQGGLLYMVLTIFVLWLLDVNNRRRNKAQQAELIRKQEKELESTRIRERNKTLENEILYKSKMLANSTITLVQKNEMLSSMKDLIRKHGQKGGSFDQLRRKLYKLIDANINNDENWEIFERNFAEVHENFLDNLKEKCPNITTGELRLAAYIKMNLASKEIAPLLNISVRSIENKRYRLRKKLNLDHETTLKQYLLSL